MIVPGRKIRTRRLALRPLTQRDAKRVGKLAGDWDIARMTARIPFPYSVKMAEEWISEQGEDECVLAVIYHFRLIGCCGFVPDGTAADIGYWIGKPWWGRGFATEAASAVVDHCFNAIGYERLTCGHFIDNAASARVIAKLGFHPTGRDRLWCDARREEVETLRYERLRDGGP